MKKTVTRIVCFALLLLLVAVLTVSCKENKGNIAMEYKDSSGKTTAVVDQSFMSFFTAISNYQNGTDGITAWDEKVQEGNENTFRDVYMALISENVKRYLKAEYLGDHVYKLGFSDEQQQSLEEMIDAIEANFGSSKALESYLSSFGTNTASLRRFMELWSKYNTLQYSLYAEGSGFEISDKEKKEYFENNYLIADHICILLTGGYKDDGTAIPLSDEEKQQKKEKSAAIMNELNSGVVDFEGAFAKYNEEIYNGNDYKSVYPDGYFVPVSGTQSGLDEAVQNAVRTMKENEIKLVETETAIYIVRRNPMNPELYKSNQNFSEGLEQLLISEDFEKQLDMADGVVVHDDVISALNPAVIPSLNVDELVG